MKCNKCNGNNVQIIQESRGIVDQSSLCKVLCTWVICLPWGIYTLLNKRDNRVILNIKYCPDCGSKSII